MTRPAWKAKPSWYLVASQDNMIPPEVQRRMATRAGSVTVEVNASHAVQMSQPAVVASLIRSAAVEVEQAAARAPARPHKHYEASKRA